MFLGSIGIMSLYYAIVSEVLSHKIRGVVTTLCLVENWLVAFLVAKVSDILYTEKFNFSQNLFKYFVLQ
jgi:uncharacterized membrane protein